ncbi:hypothetical protein Taro_000749 [Colocasia esculenta]|uniref:CCHC-type domain-containing protein n=1 Tax=Colocasia esculenta TaxID=4460 RepID=A0A843T800_COLES|nr:hypothetical protein [Colocasia esculenta]
MDCAELDQVRLAVYQLKGSAHEWWRAVRQTNFQGRRLDQITWAEFLVAFHGEFLPDYVCRERRDLFHELVQGDLTVGQYHQRFLQLLRHVPHVAASEQARTERFISGLHSDLRWAMAGHLCDTLAVAVARATSLERECQFQPQQSGGIGRSSLYQRPSGSRGSVSSSSSSGISGASLISKLKRLFARRGRRQYRQQQQRHQSEQQPVEQSVQQGAEQSQQDSDCYHCGQPGHYRRECSLRQQQEQQQQAPQWEGDRSDVAMWCQTYEVDTWQPPFGLSFGVSSLRKFQRLVAPWGVWEGLVGCDLHCVVWPEEDVLGHANPVVATPRYVAFSALEATPTLSRSGRDRVAVVFCSSREFSRRQACSSHGLGAEGENGGDSGMESFVELSWLVWFSEAWDRSPARLRQLWLFLFRVSLRREVLDMDRWSRLGSSGALVYTGETSQQLPSWRTEETGPQ